MKREIASLKKKMNSAESRARDLEVDNAQLRAHLATFVNGSGGGGEETKATVGMAMYDGLNAATVAFGPSGIDEDAANAEGDVIAADEGGGADDEKDITTEV